MIIEQELVPGCPIAAEVFARGMARIAAWSPAPCSKDWQPEPRTVRTFRTPKPWLRSLR